MQLHHKKTVFLLALIIPAFGAFFLFVFYMTKHKAFLPAPPIAEYTVAAERSPGPDAFLYSFENDGPAALRTSEKAYNGKYSTVAAGRLSFSMVVNRTAAACNLSIPSRIACSAWLYIADARSTPDASLIVMIRNKKGRELFSSAITVKGDAIPQQKWFKISGSFEIKDIVLSPDDIVSVYLWNNSKCTIYMDDLLTVFGEQKMSTIKIRHENSRGRS